jgi:hypothetical protein
VILHALLVDIQDAVGILPPYEPVSGSDDLEAVAEEGFHLGDGPAGRSAEGGDDVRVIGNTSFSKKAISFTESWSS